MFRLCLPLLLLLLLPLPLPVLDCLETQWTQLPPASESKTRLFKPKNSKMIQRCVGALLGDTAPLLLFLWTSSRAWSLCLLLPPKPLQVSFLFQWIWTTICLACRASDAVLLFQQFLGSNNWAHIAQMRPMLVTFSACATKSTTDMNSDSNSMYIHVYTL